MTLDCGCPENHPDWDGQDIDLGGRQVLAFPLPTFLHMPMGFDLYMGRVRHIINELELPQQWPGLFLVKTGWFRGQVISLLEKNDSPSHHITRLPVPFRLRVALHEGGMGTLKHTLRSMQAALLDSGRMPKALYLAHLTCPNCAEQRGGERIMVLRRWEESARLGKRLRQNEKR